MPSAKIEDPMLFLHAADIHLDSPLRGLPDYDGAPIERVRNATRDAFTNMVDLAIDRAVDFVVIAGDLYDGDWRDYSMGLYFVREMARLGKAEIPVFVLHGNHDAESRITKQLTLPETVKVFSAKKPETFKLENLGAALHGRSFQTQHVHDNLAAEYPEPIAGLFNIGVLHTALTGRVGHEPYAPCSLDDLTSRGYDYWALGHVQNRELLCEIRRSCFPAISRDAILS